MGGSLPEGVLREKRNGRAKGKMEREKVPHMHRDTERSLLPTGHPQFHQFRSHVLALLGLSNQL